MKHSFLTGVSFGLTSGIITTLGLMVGLYAGTGSQQAVIGGILTIAIADAFSDALGIHVSEESENRHTRREIWESTIATFLSKFIFALTFLVPVLLFSLKNAVIISIGWGLLMIGIFSYFMAKEQKEKPYKIIIEHIFITLIVVFATHKIGSYIASIFK
ncbi:VIT1/CCC1 transporter family protein [Patescibacteria group bacterium]